MQWSEPWWEEMVINCQVTSWDKGRVKYKYGRSVGLAKIFVEFHHWLWKMLPGLESTYERGLRNIFQMLLTLTELIESNDFDIMTMMLKSWCVGKWLYWTRIWISHHFFRFYMQGNLSHEWKKKKKKKKNWSWCCNLYIVKYCKNLTLLIVLQLLTYIMGKSQKTSQVLLILGSRLR